MEKNPLLQPSAPPLSNFSKILPYAVVEPFEINVVDDESLYDSREISLDTYIPEHGNWY